MNAVGRNVNASASSAATHKWRARQGASGDIILESEMSVDAYRWRRRGDKAAVASAAK